LVVVEVLNADLIDVLTIRKEACHAIRQTPSAPCTTILTEHEWKALSTTIHRSPTVPAVAPSVRQAVRSLAQLGGFLGLLATVKWALPLSGADGHG
jgi:hypothetical protein